MASPEEESVMSTDKLFEPLGLPPQTDPPRSPRETLPTMYDLPSEDPEEPGLPQEHQWAERERQRAEQERQRAEQAQQQAAQERQRAERLIAQLKALGIEPEP